MPIALAALLWALAPTAATAHVEVRGSEPAAGETVAEGLDTVRLSLLAFDPDVDARSSTVEVEVEPLEVGAHIVHWHALSDDGDGRSEGTFTFQVEEAPGGGWGIWLVWLFALGVPAAIFLRPGARRRSGR